MIVTSEESIIPTSPRMSPDDWNNLTYEKKIEFLTEMRGKRSVVYKAGKPKGEGSSRGRGRPTSNKSKGPKSKEFDPGVGF